MKEVGDYIFFYREITEIHLAGKGKRIQILDGKAFPGVGYRAILDKADAVDFMPGFSFGEFLYLIV
jgi:hypothetical protein